MQTVKQRIDERYYIVSSYQTLILYRKHFHSCNVLEVMLRNTATKWKPCNVRIWVDRMVQRIFNGVAQQSFLQNLNLVGLKLCVKDTHPRTIHISLKVCSMDPTWLTV